MKFLPAQLAYFFRIRTARRNLRILGKFLALLLLLVLAYSIVFHFLMAAEGQAHSWVTGFYWTLTVMSTLGFGDITFQTDAGRAFSMLVLISGVLFLLVVLPFTFIQFFYAPWLEAQSRTRAPRTVPEATRGHVILTSYDPITISLIERLRYQSRAYFVLEPDLKRALDLYDSNVPVVVGDPDSVETYERLRVSDAALVAATGDDYMNTNVTFTVREVSPEVPIISFFRAAESEDVLQLAGATRVVQLTEMLGRSLARRTLGGDARANVIGEFGEVRIVEAPVLGTPLVGRTIVESGLRQATGLTIVGVWERGDFELPRPDTVIEATSVLVLAGSDEQLGRLNELMAIYTVSDAPVLILGGGRVGRAAARELRERDVPCVIVEKDATRVREGQPYVVGDAADLECLQQAGIDEAPTTIVTTNDDATNIYLTIYCRRLRPQMQIISRATMERNVSTLHRAGADFVMSYASMGANTIINLLEQGEVLMLAEGLDVFREPVPPELAGAELRSTGIREETGCNVIALEVGGRMEINPPAERRLPPEAALILIGTTEGERRFLQRYGDAAAARRSGLRRFRPRAAK